jgi:hypothetical protein
LGRSRFYTNPGKKLERPTPSQLIKLDMVACTCHSSYVGGVNKRTVVQASQAKMQDPIITIIKAKRARGMAQVV